MNLQYTHFAMSVSRPAFTDAFIADILAFYKDFLGWSEAPALRIRGERLTVYTSPHQYVNIRASDTPMVTSGYEHLGFFVESHAHLAKLHERLSLRATQDERVSVTPINYTELGDEQVYSFRLHFLLPVAIEIQYFPLAKRT